MGDASRMTLKKLLAAAIAATLFFVSETAMAVTPPIISSTRTYVRVACPYIARSAPAILKIQRLSVENGSVIKEALVSEGEPGVGVNGRTFTFAVDWRGDNTVLGHLPGYFSIECHHSDNWGADSFFKGGIS